MAIVYFNYPNTHVTYHGDPGCGYVGMHRAPEQRLFRVRLDTLAAELRRFDEQQVDFAAARGKNDMYLDIDLGDRELELAVVDYVRRKLGRRYTPFSGVQVAVHCGD